MGNVNTIQPPTVNAFAGQITTPYSSSKSNSLSRSSQVSSVKKSSQDSSQNSSHKSTLRLSRDPRRSSSSDRRPKRSLRTIRRVDGGSFAPSATTVAGRSKTNLRHHANVLSGKIKSVNPNMRAQTLYNIYIPAQSSDSFNAICSKFGKGRKSGDGAIAKGDAEFLPTRDNSQRKISNTSSAGPKPLVIYDCVSRDNEGFATKTQSSQKNLSKLSSVRVKSFKIHNSVSKRDEGAAMKTQNAQITASKLSSVGPKPVTERDQSDESTDCGEVMDEDSWDSDVDVDNPLLCDVMRKEATRVGELLGNPTILDKLEHVFSLAGSELLALKRDKKREDRRRNDEHERPKRYSLNEHELTYLGDKERIEDRQRLKYEQDGTRRHTIDESELTYFGEKQRNEDGQTSRYDQGRSRRNSTNDNELKALGGRQRSENTKDSQDKTKRYKSTENKPVNQGNNQSLAGRQKVRNYQEGRERSSTRETAKKAAADEKGAKMNLQSKIHVNYVRSIKSPTTRTDRHSTGTNSTIENDTEMECDVDDAELLSPEDFEATESKDKKGHGFVELTPEITDGRNRNRSVMKTNDRDVENSHEVEDRGTDANYNEKERHEKRKTHDDEPLVRLGKVVERRVVNSKVQEIETSDDEDEESEEEDSQETETEIKEDSKKSREIRLNKAVKEEDAVVSTALIFDLNSKPEEKEGTGDLKTKADTKEKKDITSKKPGGFEKRSQAESEVKEGSPQHKECELKRTKVRNAIFWSPCANKPVDWQIPVRIDPEVEKKKRHSKESRVVEKERVEEPKKIVKNKKLRYILVKKNKDEDGNGTAGEPNKQNQQRSIGKAGVPTKQRAFSSIEKAGVPVKQKVQNSDEKSGVPTKQIFQNSNKRAGLPTKQKLQNSYEETVASNKTNVVPFKSKLPRYYLRKPTDKTTNTKSKECVNPKPETSVVEKQRNSASSANSNKSPHKLVASPTVLVVKIRKSLPGMKKSKGKLLAVPKISRQIQDSGKEDNISVGISGETPDIPKLSVEEVETSGSGATKSISSQELKTIVDPVGAESNPSDDATKATEIAKSLQKMTSGEINKERTDDIISLDTSCKAVASSQRKLLRKSMKDLSQISDLLMNNKSISKSLEKTIPLTKTQMKWLENLKRRKEMLKKKPSLPNAPSLIPKPELFFPSHNAGLGGQANPELTANISAEERVIRKIDYLKAVNYFDSTSHSNIAVSRGDESVNSSSFGEQSVHETDAIIDNRNEPLNSDTKPAGSLPKTACYVSINGDDSTKRGAKKKRVDGRNGNVRKGENVTKSYHVTDCDDSIKGEGSTAGNESIKRGAGTRGGDSSVPVLFGRDEKEIACEFLCSRVSVDLVKFASNNANLQSAGAKITEPVVSKTTKPGTSKLTEPGTSKITEPGTSKITEPDTSNITEPDVSTTTHPAVTQSLSTAGNHAIRMKRMKGLYLVRNRFGVKKSFQENAAAKRDSKKLQREAAKQEKIEKKRQKRMVMKIAKEEQKKMEAIVWKSARWEEGELVSRDKKRVAPGRSPVSDRREEEFVVKFDVGDVDSCNRSTVTETDGERKTDTELDCATSVTSGVGSPDFQQVTFMSTNFNASTSGSDLSVLTLWEHDSVKSAQSPIIIRENVFAKGRNAELTAVIARNKPNGNARRDKESVDEETSAVSDRPEEHTGTSLSFDSEMASEDGERKAEDVTERERKGAGKVKTTAGRGKSKPRFFAKILTGIHFGRKKRTAIVDSRAVDAAGQ